MNSRICAETDLAPDPVPPGHIALPHGTVDLAKAVVSYPDGGRCELSQREAEVLRYLASNVGRPVSRDELLLEVWRLNPQRIITRTVDMHIAHIRSKLHDHGNGSRVLKTVRGLGYMLSPCASSAN